jgi:hypothetical protein
VDESDVERLRTAVDEARDPIERLRAIAALERAHGD